MISCYRTFVADTVLGIGSMFINPTVIKLYISIYIVDTETEIITNGDFGAEVVTPYLILVIK
jgi:hypothetical protein